MPATVIGEIEAAVAEASAERREQMLERLADLFVFGAAEFTGEQIELFDDIFARLVATLELSARAALSAKLAGSAFAPTAASRLLALDEVIDVAGPMLEFHDALDNTALLESARQRSQDHLLAMSRRQRLDAGVTDVLVERGGRPVLLSMAANVHAKFSDEGYTKLIGHTEGDDELALSVGSRRELPRHHLLKLLTRASEAVRAKLESADPLSAHAIRTAVAEAVSAVQSRTVAARRDYAATLAALQPLHAEGQLSEQDIEAFGKAKKFEEATVALSLLCGLPIEQVELAMASDRADTIIILAKAAGLSWPTVKALVPLRQGGRALNTRELEQCLATFSRLKPETARQVLAFQQRRASAHTAA